MQETTKTLSQLQFSTYPETNRTNMTYWPLKKKKNKRLTLKKYKTGRWDDKEHALFEFAFMKHGNDWKSVENIIKRRSAEQIRSHSQKFHIKLLKKYSAQRKYKELIYESEFDKKFIETFRKDEKKIFHIRKIHHFHDKLSCFLRKRQKKKVFFIEKENGKTKDFFVNIQENNLKYNVTNETDKLNINEYLEKELLFLNQSNNKLLNLIKSKFCQKEINFTYSYLPSNYLNYLNLLEVSINNDVIGTFNKLITDLVNLKELN